MLSIDDLKGDAQTFQEMIAQKQQELSDASVALLKMNGALSYIMRCIKAEEDKEMEEGYKDNDSENND